MTHVHPLTVRKANATDMLAIDKLLIDCNGQIPHMMAARQRAVMEGFDVLVGHFGSSELVASQCVRFALTPNSLKDHFGFTVPDLPFPAVTSTFVCSKKPGFAETMRFVVLQAALQMKAQEIHIAGHLTASRGYAGSVRTYLERMGYEFRNAAGVISPVEVAFLPRDRFDIALNVLRRAFALKVIPPLALEGGHLF